MRAMSTGCRDCLRVVRVDAGFVSTAGPHNGKAGKRAPGRHAGTVDGGDAVHPAPPRDGVHRRAEAAAGEHSACAHLRAARCMLYSCGLPRQLRFRGLQAGVSMQVKPAGPWAVIFCAEITASRPPCAIGACRGSSRRRNWTIWNAQSTDRQRLLRCALPHATPKSNDAVHSPLCRRSRLQAELMASRYPPIRSCALRFTLCHGTGGIRCSLPSGQLGHDIYPAESAHQPVCGFCCSCRAVTAVRFPGPHEAFTAVTCMCCWCPDWHRILPQ